MTQLAAAVPLNEVDAELTLLGTMFMAPEAVALVAEDVSPDWFSDLFLRYLFESGCKLHR